MQTQDLVEVTETIKQKRKRRVSHNDLITIRKAASLLSPYTESTVSRWVGTSLPEWRLIGPDGKERTKRLTSRAAVEAFKKFLEHGGGLAVLSYSSPSTPFQAPTDALVAAKN